MHSFAEEHLRVVNMALAKINFTSQIIGSLITFVMYFTSTVNKHTNAISLFAFLLFILLFIFFVSV